MYVSIDVIYILVAIGVLILVLGAIYVHVWPGTNRRR